MMGFFNILWIIAAAFGWASTGARGGKSTSGHWGRKW